MVYLSKGKQQPTSSRETMELMTLFYSDLTKTLNPISSFEKAQEEMRHKYPTQPEIGRDLFWLGRFCTFN